MPVTLVHLIERHPPQYIHGEHHLSNREEAERYLSELGHRMFPADSRIARHVHTAEITDVPRAIAEHATELVPTLLSCARTARLVCVPYCSAPLHNKLPLQALFRCY